MTDPHRLSLLWVVYMKRRNIKEIRKTQKRTWILAFSSLLCVGVIAFCAERRNHFLPAKIRSSFTYQNEWELPYPNFEQFKLIEDVAKKKFTYLSSGSQVYSFISDDGQYILKFFKIRRLKPKTWLSYIPLPKILDRVKFEKIDKKNLSMHKVFESYKLAYENLADETGTLYLHLNKTHFLKSKVILFDKNGKRYLVDLDRVQFLVQKKADLFFDRFSAVVKTHDREKIRNHIRSILKLLKSSCEKGIVDNHSSAGTNFGFIGERAIMIDLGKFAYDQMAKEEAKIDQVIEGFTVPLKSWMKENASEYLDEVDREVAILFSSGEQ